MIINGKKFVYKLNEKEFHCAMDVTMHFVGGKWKSVVLWYLKNRTLRFSELKALIPDITEKMLTIQLKALEDDGLIKRNAFGVKPPIKVEYSLTEFGITLIPALNSVAKWGRTVGETKGRILEI